LRSFTLLSGGLAILQTALLSPALLGSEVVGKRFLSAFPLFHNGLHLWHHAVPSPGEGLPVFSPHLLPIPEPSQSPEHRKGWKKKGLLPSFCLLLVYAGFPHVANGLSFRLVLAQAGSPPTRRRLNHGNYLTFFYASPFSHLGFCCFPPAIFKSSKLICDSQVEILWSRKVEDHPHCPCFFFFTNSCFASPCLLLLFNFSFTIFSFDFFPVFSIIFMAATPLPPISLLRHFPFRSVISPVISLGPTTDVCCIYLYLDRRPHRLCSSFVLSFLNSHFCQ